MGLEVENRTNAGVMWTKVGFFETKSSLKQDMDTVRAIGRQGMDIGRTHPGHGTKVGQKLGDLHCQPAPANYPLRKHHTLCMYLLSAANQTIFAAEQWMTLSGILYPDHIWL